MHLLTTSGRLLQIFNFWAAVSAAFLVDRLGRRTLFNWSGIGMLVSFVIWTACSATFDIDGNKSAGIAVVAFVFIYVSNPSHTYHRAMPCWLPLQNTGMNQSTNSLSVLPLRYLLHTAPVRVYHRDLAVLVTSKGPDSRIAFHLRLLGAPRVCEPYCAG